MIRHATARRIASQWHGGGSSPLYALTSTGAITWGIDHELQPCQMYTGFGKQWIEIAKLREYVRHYGPRGPVANWSRMPWKGDPGGAPS